jgi:ATP-binding cassette subfamily B protein
VKAHADLNPEVWRRLAGRLRPNWRPLTAAFAISLATVASTMVSPLIFVEIINVALPDRNAGLLGWLCAGLIALGVAGAAAFVAQGALLNSAGQKAIHELRMDLYDRLQCMPLEYFSSEKNAEIQARMVNDLSGISDVVTSTANSVLTSMASLIACMVVMVILSWQLAVLSVVVLFGLTLVNRRYAGRRRELARARQEQMADLLKAISEDLSFSGILLGRTLRQHGRQRDAFADLSSSVASATYQLKLVGRSSTALSWATIGSIPPVIYWIAGTWLPDLRLGSVVVLVMLQIRIAGPIQQLVGLNSTLQSSEVMLQRVFSYLDLPASVALDRVPRPSIQTNAPAISLAAVQYRYAGRERSALQPFDLHVPSGSVTFLMGETGSGKSTLALVLAGLLAPTAGVVRVDGVPAAPALLRGLATLVPQESVMFNRTLRDNLRFAKPDATDDELLSALHIACLEPLLARLPAGLESPVGERGYQLSGGERQRLALARAVLSGTSVLILDEATSALDAGTADTVMGRLRAEYSDRTLVVVTHRQPDTRGGDRVLLVEKGVVGRVEQPLPA